MKVRLTNKDKKKQFILMTNINDDDPPQEHQHFSCKNFENNISV